MGVALVSVYTLRNTLKYGVKSVFYTYAGSREERVRRRGYRYWSPAPNTRLVAQGPNQRESCGSRAN